MQWDRKGNSQNDKKLTSGKKAEREVLGAVEERHRYTSVSTEEGGEESKGLKIPEKLRNQEKKNKKGLTRFHLYTKNAIAKWRGKQRTREPDGNRGPAGLKERGGGVQATAQKHRP